MISWLDVNPDVEELLEGVAEFEIAAQKATKVAMRIEKVVI